MTNERNREAQYRGAHRMVVGFLPVLPDFVSCVVISGRQPRDSGLYIHTSRYGILFKTGRLPFALSVCLACVCLSISYIYNLTFNMTKKHMCDICRRRAGRAVPQNGVSRNKIGQKAA